MRIVEKLEVYRKRRVWVVMFKCDRLLYIGQDAEYLVEIDLRKVHRSPESLFRSISPHVPPKLTYTRYGKIYHQIPGTEDMHPNRLVQKKFGISITGSALFIPCNYSTYHLVQRA